MKGTLKLDFNQKFNECDILRRFRVLLRIFFINFVTKETSIFFSFCFESNVKYHSFLLNWEGSFQFIVDIIELEKQINLVFKNWLAHTNQATNLLYWLLNYIIYIYIF